jgi:hypothetical protein
MVRAGRVLNVFDRRFPSRTPIAWPATIPQRAICEIVWLVASEHFYNMTHIGLNIHSDMLSEVSRTKKSWTMIGEMLKVSGVTAGCGR